MACMHANSTVWHLREVFSKVPIPTIEEEYKLIAKAIAGDRKAMNKLVAANMRTVLSVAVEYPICGIPLSDLVGEGSLGLLHAIKTFDTSRGLRLMTHARWWIRSYITKAVHNFENIIRIPSNQILYVRRTMRNKMEEGDNCDDAKELLQLMSTVSTEAQVGEEGHTVAEYVVDNTIKDPSDAIDGGRVKEALYCALSKIPSREATILYGMFGLHGGVPATAKELGHTLGISMARVVQLKNQGLRRLANNLTNHPLRQAMLQFILDSQQV